MTKTVANDDNILIKFCVDNDPVSPCDAVDHFKILRGISSAEECVYMKINGNEEWGASNYMWIISLVNYGRALLLLLLLMIFLIDDFFLSQPHLSIIQKQHASCE